MQSPFPDATQGKVDCNHVSTRYAEPQSVPLSQYSAGKGMEENEIAGLDTCFSAVLTPTAPLYLHYLALKRL